MWDDEVHELEHSLMLTSIVSKSIATQCIFTVRKLEMIQRIGLKTKLLPARNESNQKKMEEIDVCQHSTDNVIIMENMVIKMRMAIGSST